MKRYLALSLLTFCAGFVTCKYFTEPEIREVRVRDVVTVIEEHKREERRPDGTVIIETDTRKDRQSSTVSQSETVKQTLQPQWSVGAYTNVNRDRFLVTVDRRIIGNVFVGVYGSYNVSNNESAGGFGIRLEF